MHGRCCGPDPEPRPCGAREHFSRSASSFVLSLVAIRGRIRSPSLPFRFPSVPVPQLQLKLCSYLSRESSKIARSQVQFAKAPPRGIEGIKSRLKQPGRLARKERDIKGVPATVSIPRAGLSISLFQGPTPIERHGFHGFWNCLQAKYSVLEKKWAAISFRSFASRTCSTSTPTRRSRASARRT